MDFIKKFSEHDDYVLYKESGEMDLPNVSRCDDEKDIHLNHNLIKTPLTFKVLSKGEIRWTVSDIENAKTIQYKKGNGDWVSITATVEGVSIPVDIGDEVQFKGTNDAYTNESTQFNNFKYTSCIYELYGNIMSMIYGDNFASATTFPENSSLNFFNFFRATKVKSARHLMLPIMTLVPNCYAAMFCGCTLLSSVPSVLPATTLASSCYNKMFQGTAITTAPDIKAETLASGCCNLMFEGCKNITQSPTLRATTLTSNCYNTMFQNCSNLNTITCYATDVSASGALTNWVRNVSSTGTFYKHPDSTWSTGNNGIPSGWTIVTMTIGEDE